MQEVELAEVLDDLALHRALEGEVELLERLAGREALREPSASNAEKHRFEAERLKRWFGG